MSFKRLSYCKPNMEDNETKHQKELFVLEMAPILLKDYEPIFFNEAGFMLNQKKMYRWVPKGQKAIMESSSRTVTKSRVLCYMLVKGWVYQYILAVFFQRQWSCFRVKEACKRIALSSIRPPVIKALSQRGFFWIKYLVF